MALTEEFRRVYLPDVVGKNYGDFWRDRSLYRILKGGKGSKKSVTTALWFIYNLMKYPLANALVVRNVRDTHKDSTFALLKWAARRLQVFHLWKFNVSPLEATYLPTGQKILFRGFDDVDKLMSITVEIGVLCWVWIEEAFEISEEDDFDKLDLSIRGVMPEGLWKQFTMTYNPWVYTHWTKPRFWDPVKAPKDVFRKTTTYLDNEFLDDADRQKIINLQLTNPARYKVVGLGDYGLPGGAYFDMWRDKIHICDPFSIPAEWKIFPGMDYGNETLAEFITQNPKTGTFYICSEFEVNSVEGARIEGKEKALRYRQHVQRYFSDRHLQLTGDVNMFAKFPEFGIDAPISADYFRKEGIDLVPVVKKGQDHMKFRVSMNEFVKDLIYWKQDKNGHWVRRPKLYVFRTCKKFIETFPMLRTDEKDDREINPYLDDGKNKKTRVKIDHAYDAAKYGMTRFITAENRKVNEDQRKAIRKVLWKTSRVQG